MRGVPTGMKWNAVEWWNTAVHAPAFLLSSPLLVPFFSFSFSFFLPLLLLLFPPFNRAAEQSRAPLSRPFLAPVDRVPSCRFPLASYVRNEPQLIHHNRFTCISAGTFTLPPLSLSSIPPPVVSFAPIRWVRPRGSLGNIVFGWDKDQQVGLISGIYYY